MPEAAGLSSTIKLSCDSCPSPLATCLLTWWWWCPSPPGATSLFTDCVMCCTMLCQQCLAGCDMVALGALCITGVVWGVVIGVITVWACHVMIKHCFTVGWVLTTLTLSGKVVIIWWAGIRTVWALHCAAHKQLCLYQPPQTLNTRVGSDETCTPYFSPPSDTCAARWRWVKYFNRGKECVFPRSMFSMFFSYELDWDKYFSNHFIQHKQSWWLVW